jgi:hypothetical protein
MIDPWGTTASALLERKSGFVYATKNSLAGKHSQAFSLAKNCPESEREVRYQKTA